MNDKNQRRRFQRYAVSTLVWWNRDWEPEPIAVRDLSAGGMLCEFPKGELAVGDEVDLDFEFPGRKPLVHCRCQVVHVREDSPGFQLIGLKRLKVEGMPEQDFVQLLQEDNIVRAVDQSSPSPSGKNPT